MKLQFLIYGVYHEYNMVMPIPIGTDIYINYTI